MYIDSHVHLRDFEQSEKETVKHGLEVARDSGVDAVFDMPNTNPPIMTKELVKQRLKLAEDANVPEVFYGLHMGLTVDSEQIKEAVGVYRDYENVIGMKLYAGHSVGNLGVIRSEDQQRVYETLTGEGYDGALFVHCEKESEMDHGSWNHVNPFSHCLARPEKSEIESVRDQITLAKKYSFLGKLHVAHISSPGAVNLVVKAKEEGLDISSGICPHHFIYDYKKMEEDDGVLWKMNPPLRSPDSREKMLNYLREGKIDWIETDHAPHTLKDKTQGDNNRGFASGIPGLPWWNFFEEFLRQNNFSEGLIEKIVFSNVVERFSLDIGRSKRRIVDRRGDYPFNPYLSLERELL
jgi:dihydroorotase